MPIELTRNESHLLVRMVGIVTAADFVRYAQESEALDSGQPRSLDRITDLTGVERFDVTHRDMFELADRRKRHDFTRPVKSAIIAREPVQIGMARMFQTLGEHPQIEIRIVSTMRDALDWLEEPPGSGARG